MIYYDSFENWVFDLDNTIYDIKLGLFRKVSKRITSFIMNKYNLPEFEAKSIQKDYYLKYGLTLRGLIIEKKLAPDEFLDYVHDVDHPELIKDKQTIDILKKLIGNKIIFTNATFKHAEKILNLLNIREYFDVIIDIKDLEYIPKPNKNSYKMFLKKIKFQNFDLNKTIFLEDTVKNLIPAKELGMTTVWMRNEMNQNDYNCNSDFIDYAFDNFKSFLMSLKSRGKYERK